MRRAPSIVTGLFITHNSLILQLTANASANDFAPVKVMPHSLTFSKPILQFSSGFAMAMIPSSPNLLLHK